MCILFQNVCGTLTALISIASKAFSPNARTAAIYYFITALFILLACLDTYFALPLNVNRKLSSLHSKVYILWLVIMWFLFQQNIVPWLRHTFSMRLLQKILWPNEQIATFCNWQKQKCFPKLFHKNNSQYKWTVFSWNVCYDHVEILYTLFCCLHLMSLK